MANQIMKFLTYRSSKHLKVVFRYDGVTAAWSSKHDGRERAEA